MVLVGLTLYGGGLITAWAKRKREPAEVAKIDAETAHQKVTTELMPVDIAKQTLRELREVSDLAERRRKAWAAREDRLIGQRNHWQHQAIIFERRAVQAEADAQAAIMFVDQMHAAANLKGVRLADYTPKQLKDEIDRMKKEEEDVLGDNNRWPESGTS